MLKSVSLEFQTTMSRNLALMRSHSVGYQVLRSAIDKTPRVKGATLAAAAWHGQVSSTSIIRFTFRWFCGIKQCLCEVFAPLHQRGLFCADACSRSRVFAMRNESQYSMFPLNELIIFSA